MLALAAFLAAASEAAAQERIVVEERTGEVLRVVGRTVVIRNDLGEVKQYTDLPEDVELFIGGEPAEIEDLREGMLLYGVRFENVPPPRPVTPVASRPRPDRPAQAESSKPGGLPYQTQINQALRKALERDDAAGPGPSALKEALLHDEEFLEAVAARVRSKPAA